MEALKHKLYITFVKDDNYRFFLSGLGTTLLLTFASFLLGTVLAIALCAALRSKKSGVRKAAGVIRAFFAELPTMVLLMILVYVVFGRSSLPVLWVVIFGLTLKTATYLTEVFDAALQTVASGETEAARTLGMTRWQAFYHIVLPQTVRSALPMYRTQFTDSLEETSIVGYLAVVDLTRASEIVSSRTMDAFVGLFTIAIVYFIIGAVVKCVISKVASRKRNLKASGKSANRSGEVSEKPGKQTGEETDRDDTRIRIKNITKRFDGKAVLEKVNLDIHEGESVVIIGESGGGKSTLLRCINRLLVPEEGEILIDGVNILAPGTDLNAVRRHMGMVYQHFNLFSHLTVLENIILAPMKVGGVSYEDAVREAKELLNRVGMAGREQAMPAELSGGQKQRVAIARTLAMHPDIILFDEPTSALDPTMVYEVETVIRSLIDDGITSVLVTHDLQFARKVATRVVFVAEQGICEEGTPAEIFEHPKKTATQRFLYRSRMYEKELTPEALDLYALTGELKAFLRRYEFEPKQEKLLPVLCDELIYPVLKSETYPATGASLRFLLSETSTRHTVLIRFRGIETDPLAEPYLDELNLAILNNYAEFLLSSKKEDGWEVCIQL